MGGMRSLLPPPLFILHVCVYIINNKNNKRVTKEGERRRRKRRLPEIQSKQPQSSEQGGDLGPTNPLLTIQPLNFVSSRGRSSPTPTQGKELHPKNSFSYFSMS